jgi:hypothetical protein
MIHHTGNTIDAPSIGIRGDDTPEFAGVVQLSSGYASTIVDVGFLSILGLDGSARFSGRVHPAADGCLVEPPVLWIVALLVGLKDSLRVAVFVRVQLGIVIAETAFTLAHLMFYGSGRQRTSFGVVLLSKGLR